MTNSPTSRRTEREQSLGQEEGAGVRRSGPGERGRGDVRTAQCFVRELRRVYVTVLSLMNVASALAPQDGGCRAEGG